jgi:transcriptional regulator with XRE-family HTH domain
MHGRLGHLGRIGNAVREARRAEGMTQLTLAIAAGFGLAAVRGVEGGIGRITSLNAVLRALGLEIRGRNLMAGHVGPALALARKRRKVSRRQLARALNVSRNTLASVESGGGSMAELESYGAAVGAGLYLAKVGEAKPFFVNAGNSSSHHGWETPSELSVSLSEAVGGFDLDPCNESPTCQSQSPCSADRQ